VGLQAATTSGRPVVLRVEAHGEGGIRRAGGPSGVLCRCADGWWVLPRAMTWS